MGRTERAARILHTCVLYNVAWLLFFYCRPLTMSLLTPKLPATLLPILGHLLLCCEKQHPCSLFKRYSFVCLFNATSNLIPDHQKLESIISGCRADCITCRKSWVEGSLEDGSSALCRARAVPSRPSIPLPQPRTCCTCWPTRGPKFGFTSEICRKEE